MYSCIFFGKDSGKIINGLNMIFKDNFNIISYEKINYFVSEGYPIINFVLGENNMSITGENVILVFTDNEKYNVKIKKCLALLCESSSVSSVKFGIDKNFLVIDYGLSQKSTITFSSIGEENDVISIQRNITLADSTVIEPMDIKLQKHVKNPKTELIYTAIKLITKL